MGITFINKIDSDRIGVLDRLRDQEFTSVDMINAYRDHPNKLMIKTSLGDRRLNGFRVDRSDIEDLLSDPNAKEIFIMLGVASKDLGSEHAIQKFTTVLVALEHEFAGNKNSAKILTSKAYDFCDPCPTACPTNIYTIYPYKPDE